jgi:hypothetical protein
MATALGLPGLQMKNAFDRGVLQFLQFLVRVLEPILLPRVDVHHLEAVVLQVRHLEVGGEDGGAEGDPVALVQQAVALQRLEDVAHRGRAALDREQVELAGVRIAAAHGPIQVLVRHPLVVDEHPVRHRVVVADDRIDQLVDEGVSVEAERLDRERHHALQELGTGHVLVLLEPAGEAVGDPVLRGHAAHARRQVHHPSRLGHRELAQEEEALARGGGDPVRVAAPGVEEHVRGFLGLRLGELDQLVLDLERAQGLVRAERHDVHVRNSLLPGVSSDSPAHASNRTITRPKMVSSVLPTAYGMP